jgi:hypothetical protein
LFIAALLEAAPATGLTGVAQYDLPVALIDAHRMARDPPVVHRRGDPADPRRSTVRGSPTVGSIHDGLHHDARPTLDPPDQGGKRASNGRRQPSRVITHDA